VPFDHGWAVCENADDEFNKEIVATVADVQSNGKRIYLAHLRNTVTLDDLEDGLHSNASGYEKMPQVWAEVTTTLQTSPATKRPARNAGSLIGAPRQATRD